MNLTEWVAKQREADRRGNAEREQQERHRLNQQDKARACILPSLRPATREDYIAWLQGYVTSGRTPTHFYDYPWERNNNAFTGDGWGPAWYVACADVALLPLFGSAALNIIVPVGFTIAGDPGHTHIYPADYKALFVPVYSDTIPGGTA